MRWDFFYRPESHRVHPSELTPYCYQFELPADTTLADALKYAHANGMPRGSARGGCFEVQNDLGIHWHRDYQRIDLSTPKRAANVIFKTWEQLEQEELEQ